MSNNTEESYQQDLARIIKNGRQRIDWLDHTLQTLLIERAALAKQLGWAKQARQTTPSLHVPAREQEILAKRHAQDSGDLLPEELDRIWGAIMAACLHVQERHAVEPQQHVAAAPNQRA
jgi:Chorismate mutase